MASNEVLQERLRLLQLKASNKRKQFEDGEQWLAQLAEEKAVAESQFEKARQDLINYAQKECFALCTMMYERLPKELRDTVYQYLCIDEGHIPIGPYYHFRIYDPMETEISKSDSESDEDLTIVMPDGRLKHDHSHRPPSDKILPSSYMFNREYVGLKVACELLKVYYSENAFSICNIDFESLRNHPCTYEERDDFPGFRPIDYMQNLQIRIKAEKFLTESTQQDLSLFAGHFTELCFLRDIVSDFDGLWRIIQNAQSKQQLQMELVLMTDLSPPEIDRADHGYRMINFLESMRTFVYKAMYDRENTTIRVTHHDDSLWPFPKNYTNMFGLTKEQWHHEKASQKNDVGRGNGYWVNPTHFRHEKLFEKAENAVFADELDDFIRERWGIRSPSDIRCTLPITEGKYWPARNLERGSSGHEGHTG